MQQLRALWWWIDRWRKSTAYTDMTLEEQGAYRNLLDEVVLRGGPLPNDEHILAKACGDPRRWKKVRAKVLHHFELTDNQWRNATLDEVMARSEELRQERAEAGRRGASARWQTDSKHHGKRHGKPDGKHHGKRMPSGSGSVSVSGSERLRGSCGTSSSARTRPTAARDGADPAEILAVDGGGADRPARQLCR